MNLIWTPSQLAMLAKVVDLHGFSAAARALGVPKAAVSRAVADLEKTLGVRVLERTTRRVSACPPRRRGMRRGARCDRPPAVA
jgi:DNA-binding transcriptional LysR family regulator